MVNTLQVTETWTHYTCTTSQIYKHLKHVNWNLTSNYDIITQQSLILNNSKSKTIQNHKLITILHEIGNHDANLHDHKLYLLHDLNNTYIKQNSITTYIIVTSLAYTTGNSCTATMHNEINWIWLLSLMLINLKYNEQNSWFSILNQETNYKGIN